MFHIVSSFPELLSFSFFAPFILRTTLGLRVLGLGLKKETDEQIHPVIRGLFTVSGIFIILGFLTQITALVLVCLLGTILVKPQLLVTKKITSSEITLLIIIAFSLLFTGAGGFAIDYPF